jgi:hypothetical protein
VFRTEQKRVIFDYESKIFELSKELSIAKAEY